jgi:hypothetical protein
MSAPTTSDHEIIALCAKVYNSRELYGALLNKLPASPASDDIINKAVPSTWELTEQAMAIEPATLFGAGEQVKLLLWHHANDGNGPAAPAIELPVLRSLMRLLPVA